MTNKTMELLEQVLRKPEKGLIDGVTDALARFRASGKPADEEALRAASEEYLRVLEEEKK